MSDDADANVDCSNLAADRCKFEHSKDVTYDQECVSYDSSLMYDIEHRYNVIEELANGGEDNSGRAFKLKYQCKKDLCNDEDHYEKVVGLDL